MSDAPRGTLETADKLAVDDAYPKAHLNDQLPGIPALSQNRNVQVDDSPIPDLHLSMVETVDKSADVRRADTFHPDVVHTPNGGQQIPMQSTSPKHWKTSFLGRSDLQHKVCSYQGKQVPDPYEGVVYAVETCAEEEAEVSSEQRVVVYTTRTVYFNSMYGYKKGNKRDPIYLRLKFGAKVYEMGLIDFGIHCSFECIVTEDGSTCTAWLGDMWPSLQMKRTQEHRTVCCRWQCPNDLGVIVNFGTAD